jgi:hypothetical protein
MDYTVKRPSVTKSIQMVNRRRRTWKVMPAEVSVPDFLPSPWRLMGHTHDENIKPFVKPIFENADDLLWAFATHMTVGDTHTQKVPIDGTVSEFSLQPLVFCHTLSMPGNRSVGGRFPDVHLKQVNPCNCNQTPGSKQQESSTIQIT